MDYVTAEDREADERRHREEEIREAKPAYEAHTIRAPSVPGALMNRHERRRYAALSRRAQTR